MSNKSIILLFIILTHTVSNIEALERSVLPDIQVIGSHLSDNPASVKNALIIITSDHINLLRPRTVTELLQSLPGIDANQSGSSGGRSYVSIRGGDPNFTLFLVNGVKVNNPTNSNGGGVDLAFINPATIERIEIYPGGLSSVQGAGSLGGVISITTKDHSMATGITTSISKGSNNDTRLSFSAISPFSNTPHMFGLSGSFQKGGKLISGDKHVNRNISGTVDFELQDNILLTGNITSTNGYAVGFPEDSGGYRLSTRRETEKRDQKSLASSLKLFAELPTNWILTTQASIYNSHEQINSPGISAGFLAAVPPHYSDNKFQRDEFSMTFNRSFLKSKLSIGGDYVKEEGSSHEIIDFGFPLTGGYHSKREVFGLYGEVAVSVSEKLTIDGSARHEMPSSNKDTNLFRLAATYKLTDSRNTIQASWSEGFKLPSLFSLGSFLVGNSNLRPETSDIYEIRYSGLHSFWDTSYNFSIFRSEFRDLIDFDSTSFTMVNRDRVKVSGAEISMSTSPISPLSLDANLSYNDARIVNESTKLRRRPLWKGNISAIWTNGMHWNMRLDANYKGQFYDSSIPTGMIKMPSFWSIDAAVNWEISDHTAINLKIVNLLNDLHEESIGFPSSRREAFVTFTTSL